ncbi:hypothetical protein [Nonomuraea sp. NPDC002799]
MRVGHGTAELAVPDGTPMGGYIDRPGPSAGRLDPLSVAAVTWFDGERRFALATADVICVNEDLAHRVRSEARSLGCELWLAASHTHSGPETGCVPGGAPTPGPWLDRLSEAVGVAVRRAIEDERRCDGEARHGELHDVGADRSRPSAPAVVPLTVIAVREDAGGRLAGVLVVLPVHPTVLPAASRLVSADLVGAVRRALRARLGPDVWALVATGAAGDISTRHTRRGQDAAELDRLAAIVADRCLELLREPPAHAWSAGSGIAWAARRLLLAPFRPGEEGGPVGADLAALADGLRAAEAAGDPVAVRLARSRLEGLRARPQRTNPDPSPDPSASANPAPDTGAGANTSPDPIGVHVYAARLGDLSLAGLPGEPFLAVAESVAPGGPVMVLGYVNGYPGYLPTAEAYGRAEYEVLVSQVAPGSAEALAGAARQLLEDI